MPHLRRWKTLVLNEPENGGGANRQNLRDLRNGEHLSRFDGLLLSLSFGMFSHVYCPLLVKCEGLPALPTPHFQYSPISKEIVQLLSWVRLFHKWSAGRIVIVDGRYRSAVESRW